MSLFCVVCLIRNDTRFDATMVLDGHSLCDEHARHLASGIPIRVLLGTELNDGSKRLDGTT